MTHPEATPEETTAPGFQTALWRDGYAIVPGVLNESAIAPLIGGYGDNRTFRSTITMSRHNYGSGEYRYYRYALPEVIDEIRHEWYRLLAPIANLWNEATRNDERYPGELDAYLAACHEKGQPRPTPLILRYTQGDFNCMHQDVYGASAFPLQMTIMLSRRGADYDGGGSVLLEQAPRLQAKPIVLTIDRGAGLIFPNRYRPRRNKAGQWARYNVRHGVAMVTRGQRYALGIIFHDAQ